MHYIAAGIISPEDPLFSLFFAKASPALRAQTVGDVGWQLTQETAQLDPAVQKRLMDFSGKPDSKRDFLTGRMHVRSSVHSDGGFRAASFPRTGPSAKQSQWLTLFMIFIQILPLLNALRNWPRDIHMKRCIALELYLKRTTKVGQFTAGETMRGSSSEKL